MNEKLNIANVVTASRIVFAAIILSCDAFSTRFYIFYLLGAFTDMIDGTIARKLSMKSSFGSKLDSIADGVFVLAVLISIASSLYVSKWLWVWIAIVACIKIINLISSLLLFHRLVPMHTTMNKVTGVLLFMLPLTLSIVPLIYTGIPICSVATFAAVQEGHFIRTGKGIKT